MRRFWIFLLLLWPTLGFGQGAATLIADSVTLNDQDQLIATGNVEVLYLGDRLTARQILYDRASDQLKITGPIVIQTSDGTLLTADQASLDPQLQNGMLQGARIVLDQQLQLAANQIDRSDGRYSQLYKTAATSCRVCANQTPLWEIRAERVIHDGLERQLYFTNATFHVKGVPIFWVPRMRLPDPTLTRANGLLIPEQRNTTQLGFGVKLPYFITLGHHADVTLTPYVSADTTTLELRYRQAFVNGNFSAEGAISEDSLVAPRRSYIFAEGDFDIGNGVQLAFDIEAVSDPAYLLDYGYSSKDRLDSAISLLRVTDTTLEQGRFTYYQTLRDDESNASLPPIIADATSASRTHPSFGGTLRIEGSIDANNRYSDVDGETGRDIARAGLRGGWQNSWILPGGLVAEASTQLRGDLYTIADDTEFPDRDLRIVPSVGGQLSWPLGNVSGSGATNIIEPTVSFSWSDSYGSTPPNEDSTRSELDPGNLFDVSRFAGDDVVETGGQAAVGVTWTRFGSTGATSTLSFGRVLHTEAQQDFTLSSGMDDQQSDWLLGGQLIIPGGLLIDARGLIDEDNGLNRADGRVAWQNETVSLAAAYIWTRSQNGRSMARSTSVTHGRSAWTHATTWQRMNP